MSSFSFLFCHRAMNLLTLIHHMCRITLTYSCRCANLRFIDLVFPLAALPGNHNDSSSCSSGPESPNGPGDNSGRTQYVSATCVVVTNYSGDVANIVDEHFSRALNFNDKNSKGEFCA
jgi:Vestigial/Tondu family